MDYPKPFLKWPGGKTQLLDELLGLIPDAWTSGRRKMRYHEPFLGAGADGGAHAICRAAGEALLRHEVSSPDVLFDIDEPADLQAAGTPQRGGNG